MSGSQPVEVHRAADRFRTGQDGIVSWHSFSYGRHYDPSNTSYGPLLALNDQHLEPGAGFAIHPHRDVEILTWVVTGTLLHEDSAGSRSLLRPGQVHRISAGSGVQHSERNEAGSGPLRIVQTWVQPDELGVRPGSEHATVQDELEAGDLVLVASGRPQDHTAAVVRLGCGSAALHAARPRRGQAVVLPTAPLLLALVTRGAVRLEPCDPPLRAEVLRDGDAVRLTGTGPRRLVAETDAEVLVWELHAGS